MPRAASTSKNPMVPPHRAARRTGAERSLAPPTGTLPTSGDGGLRLTSQPQRNIREVPGQISRPPRTYNSGDRDDEEDDEDVDPIHADCAKMIDVADARNLELTDKFNALRRAATANAQRFRQEKADMASKIHQYQLEIKDQSGQIQHLNGQVTRLEKLLETANLNARDLLSRRDLQQTLEGIRTDAQVFMGHLQSKIDDNETRMDENRNAQNFSELPDIDVTGDWLDEALAEIPTTMFPTSDPEDAQNI